MIKADVGAIAARLLAVVVAIHTVPALPTVALLFGYPVASAGGAMVQAGAFVLYIILAILLWTGADRIGRQLAGRNAKEVVSRLVSADDLLFAAYIAVGAIFLLLAATGLIGSAWPTSSPSASLPLGLFEPSKGTVVVEAMRAALAALLIAGARPLISLTRRQREEA